MRLNRPVECAQYELGIELEAIEDFFKRGREAPQLTDPYLDDDLRFF